MVPCIVERTAVGWWITFPRDHNAGLLIDKDSEKIQFAKDCEVDLYEEDLLLAPDFGAIDECPDEYYQIAKNFREIPF